MIFFQENGFSYRETSVLAANERWGLSFADHHAQGKVVKHGGVKSLKKCQSSETNSPELVKSRIIIQRRFSCRFRLVYS